MARLPVQQRQDTADHRIPGAREPPTGLRGQLLDIAPQRLDEQSVGHLGEQGMTMNPTSNTSAVDVPPMTNVDVTFNPLAYADNVNRSAQAAAKPTTITKYRLCLDRVIGVPLTFSVIANVKFARNATPVTMVAPRTGWMPGERRHREARQERERQIVRHDPPPPHPAG
jgi:hypothetical protein